MELARSFISLIIPIIVIALLVWVANLLPIAESYKGIIRSIGIVLVVLYLLYALIEYVGR